MMKPIEHVSKYDFYCLRIWMNMVFLQGPCLKKRENDAVGLSLSILFALKIFKELV